MIQIEGLTPLQVELCDIIYETDSQEHLLAWFDTLPRRLRVQAHAMHCLMTAETLDLHEPDLEMARAVLRDIMRNH